MKKHKMKTIKQCVLARDFLATFSVAGVNKIYSSDSRLKSALWSMLLLTNLLLMSYMTYKVVNEYFEYKKTVEETSVILSTMDFPAVTICSPIPLPRSRADVAGVEHLIRLEQFLQNTKKLNGGPDRRQLCNRKLACMWSWFEDKCNCLSNPCESEYCEPGYPICECSSMLCDQYPDTCFHIRNMTVDYDDMCFCRNKTAQTSRIHSTSNLPNESDSILDEINDTLVRDLLSVIRNSKVEDLTDVAWAFQPNIYSITNFGTSFDNLVIGCSFHKERCDKRNFTVLYTSTHGECYSFNYAGELAKDRKILETKRYGWNSGLQLYLQIREDEALNILSKEIGVIVVVHDPRKLPYVSEFGLTVRAGDSAALRVQRQHVNRLGHPWGRCLTSGRHLPFNYSDNPYSQLGCQRYCQNYYIHEKCNCFKRSLLKPSVKRPKKQRLVSICNFTIVSQRQCADEVIELIENETISCNCYQACREDIFQTSLTAGNINKIFFRLVRTAKTLHIENGSYSSSFVSNKSNILGLKVYYGTLSLQNTTERPAYSWETLVANIGGNLGFFMGLTLITFLEVAEFMLNISIYLIQSTLRRIFCIPQ